MVLTMVRLTSSYDPPLGPVHSRPVWRISWKASSPCRSGRPSRCIFLPGARRHLPVSDDGGSHVRPGATRTPRGIGGSSGADQEVLVADVEVILLKLAHLKTAVAVFPYNPAGGTWSALRRAGWSSPVPWRGPLSLGCLVYYHTTLIK